MSSQKLLKITTVEESDVCISCFENTTDRVNCCDAAICRTCYLEWLKTKRQCMHCKEDQCDFDTWVNEYRIEPEFDPQEYLHELLQQNNGVLDTNPMFTHAQGFGINNLLHVITQNLYDAAGENPTYMMDPGELPPPNEPFEFQFGFTLTPTDSNGNPTGPGVTVTQNMDYGGDQHLYEQIQQAMEQYQGLYNHDGNAQPPWLQPPDNNDVPPGEWPWINDQPPNCNQQ